MRHSLLMLFTVVAVGCGSDRVSTYPVSGRVVFENGRPVRHGTVEFTSVQHGTTASGTIDHDGGFVLGTYTPDDGAAAGEHDAIVVQMLVDDGSFTHTVDHGDPVPTRYATYESTPLSASVSSDSENNLTITIDQGVPERR